MIRSLGGGGVSRVKAERGVAVPAATTGSMPPFACDAAEVAASLGTETASGLSAPDAARRLERFGPNEIAGEAAPSVWAVALNQFRNPDCNAGCSPRRSPVPNGSR
jgi:hypothetical protein